MLSCKCNLSMGTLALLNLSFVLDRERGSNPKMDKKNSCINIRCTLKLPQVWAAILQRIAGGLLRAAHAEAAPPLLCQVRPNSAVSEGLAYGVTYSTRSAPRSAKDSALQALGATVCRNGHRT